MLRLYEGECCRSWRPTSFLVVVSFAPGKQSRRDSAHSESTEQEKMPEPSYVITVRESATRGSMFSRRCCPSESPAENDALCSVLRVPSRLLTLLVLVSVQETRPGSHPCQTALFHGEIPHRTGKVIRASFFPWSALSGSQRDGKSRRASV